MTASINYNTGGALVIDYVGEAAIGLQGNILNPEGVDLLHVGIGGVHQNHLVAMTGKFPLAIEQADLESLLHFSQGQLLVRRHAVKNAVQAAIVDGQPVAGTGQSLHFNRVPAGHGADQNAAFHLFAIDR